MLKVKADTNMTQKTKDRQWDGRSRAYQQIYTKKNLIESSVKKNKLLHEMAMEGYEEEKKMLEEEE